MDLIADGLLIAGTLAAAFYCWVLSRRVKSLKDLDQGLGAAIASLSKQVDEMQRALGETKLAAEEAFSDLEIQTEAAREEADRLEKLTVKSEPAAPPKKKSASNIMSLRKSAKSEQEAAPSKPKPAQANSEMRSAAERLQEGIRERVQGRGDGQDRDDFVKALQTVLAAANK